MPRRPRRAREPAAAVAGAVAWHDVECASYAADLPLWRELAAERGGPVLDVGAGTGRVALDLAAPRARGGGHRRGPRARARLRRARPRARASPCARWPPTRARSTSDRAIRWRSCPMQVAQLLGGGGRTRGDARQRARATSSPAGCWRWRWPTRSTASRPATPLPRFPTCSSVDGWVLSSTPVACAHEGRSVAIDRHRQAVSPAGELTEEAFTIRLDSVVRAGARGRGRRRGLHGVLARAACPRHARLRGQHGRHARGAAMSPTLRVCALYPELMNIYADRGNIAVLRARCEWRGLGFELAAASTGADLDPDAHDLFYIGGGQDRDQVAVAEDMAATKREALHAAAGRGAVVLAVCGGYQLLGHSYQMGDRDAAGHRPRGPAHRPRGRPAPDRQLRDRGRPGHGPTRHRRLREPRRADLPRRQRAAARPRPGRSRQQRRRRPRGRPPRAT